MPKKHEPENDFAFASGYAIGVLSQRYWALHSKASHLPIPTTDVPLIVQTLIETMCRAALDKKLYGDNCSEIDRYLLASSPEELRTMLHTVPDCRLQ